MPVVYALVTLGFDPVAEARRNWEARGWGAPDAMAAATSIIRAHQIVIARVNDALTPFGLTFSRFEALALLSFTRAGELPLGKMGARLQVHPTSITNTIDRLEADGLVERVPHPDDRRTTLARITPAGSAVVAEAEVALAAIGFGLEAMAPEDLARLADVLRSLRAAAGDFTD